MSFMSTFLFFSLWLTSTSERVLLPEILLPHSFAKPDRERRKPTIVHEPGRTRFRVLLLRMSLRFFGSSSSSDWMHLTFGLLAVVSDSFRCWSKAGRLMAELSRLIAFSDASESFEPFSIREFYRWNSDE